MKTAAEMPIARNAPPPFMDDPDLEPPGFEAPPPYHARPWLTTFWQPFRRSCRSCGHCTYQRCRQPQLALIPAVIAVCLMAIIFGIFFGVIYPTVLARENYQSTTCTSLSLSYVSSRCCSIHDCSCSECPSFGVTANCGGLVQQSLNNSICCGGSQCCRTSCHTCCSTICTGTGSDRHCSLICKDCNCYCSASVNHQTCSFQCGVCSAFDLLYLVQATGLQLHNQGLNCGLNDDSCVFRTFQQFGANQTWPCWYDTRDFSQVRFDGLPDYHKGNLAAFGIFCTFLLILFLGWIFICIKH